MPTDRPYAIVPVEAITAMVRGLDFQIPIQPGSAAHKELAMIAASPPVGEEGLRETLAFLDRIEGDGYGGTAEFEIARENVRALLSHITGESDKPSDHMGGER